MHHALSTDIAGSRERELRTVVRRPDRLMAHELELAGAVPPTRPARPSHHTVRSRRRSS